MHMHFLGAHVPEVCISNVSWGAWVRSGMAVVGGCVGGEEAGAWGGMRRVLGCVCRGGVRYFAELE